MAAFDYTEKTAGDYFTFSIIPEIWLRQQALKDLIHDKLDRNVSLIVPDTSKGDSTIPYPALFNIIETNLRNLVATDTPGKMFFTKTWYGGKLDEEFLSYKDVNRWYAIMEAEYYYCLGYDDLLFSGMAYSGQEYDLQILEVQ